MPDTTAADAEPRCWVLLYAAGPSLLDRCIRWFERRRYPASAAQYVHAAILLHTLAGYLLAEEQGHGPEYETGANALKRAAEAAAHSVVSVTAAQQTMIVGYLDSMRRTPYAFAQLAADGVAMLTGIRTGVPTRGDVCSEMVGEALLVPRIVPPPLGIDARTITPPDLATWPVPVTAGPPPLA